MKKFFSSINKFFKKYQATIQTVGIFAIVISLIINIVQFRLLQIQANKLEQNEVSKNNSQFRVDIKENKTNGMIDRFEFSSIRPNQILQSVDLYILDGIELTNINSYKKSISSINIKKLILDISKDFYSQYTTGFLNFKVNSNITETLSYPIIIYFKYLENDELKNKSLLYEYKFKIYFFNDVRKIKSEGIEYIKLMNEDAMNFGKVLLDYSINLSKPLNSKMYQNSLKNLLIEKDTIYSLIKKLIDIDMISEKSVIKYKSCDCDSLITDLYFYIPSFYNNNDLLKTRDSLLMNIFNNEKSFNNNILNKVIHIQDSINMFTTRKSIIDKNELTKDSFELFESQFDYWIKMHQELYNETLNGFNLTK